MIPALVPQACLGGHWQAAPDIGIRVLIFSATLALGVWAAARRFFPGQRAFVALCAVIALWIAATVAEHSAAGADCKGAIALIAWLAILWTPPLWVLFLHQYLDSETRAPGLRRRFLWALPSALLMLAVVSNGEHGLFYGPATTLGEPIHGLPRLRYDYGPLFMAAVGVGYFWLLVAVALVLRGWSQANPGMRSQWVAFLIVMAIPVAGNIAYLGFGARLLGGDPTGIGFAASVLGFAWLIRRNQLFDVVPLARRLLFTELPDPVLILDACGRVVEANVAATHFGAPAHLGRPLAEWPRIGVALASHLAQDPASTALVLADPYVVYDVRRRDLGEGPRRIGTMVLLHDITAYRQAHTAAVETLAVRDAELSEAAAAQVLLREQAMRDPLTGLLNRRALDDRFRQDAAHAEHTGRSLALVLVDLDHFKRINDTYGHAAGDAVLREFESALRTGLRASDSVFRFGGEEFALLLPGADAEQAANRVQALRGRVNGRVLGGIDRTVTFSAGVISAEGARMSLEELLRAADRALYAAKAGGRNCSVVAGAVH